MPPLLIALGQLLLSANDLEDGLIELSWVSGSRTRDQVLDDLRGKTLGKVREYFVRTYRQSVTDPALLETLRDLEPRLQRAVEQRNAFVHASWRPESSSGRVPVERRRRLRRGAVAVELLEFTPEEVFEVAWEIDAVAVALWELLNATATVLGLELPEDLSARLHDHDNDEDEDDAVGDGDDGSKGTEDA